MSLRTKQICLVRHIFTLLSSDHSENVRLVFSMKKVIFKLTKLSLAHINTQLLTLVIKVTKSIKKKTKIKCLDDIQNDQVIHISKYTLIFRVGLKLNFVVTPVQNHCTI